jgi:hypothetical protein
MGIVTPPVLRFVLFANACLFDLVVIS